MSLIVYLETAEGELLLAGDSRLSYENDPYRHEDNTFKIFDYDGRIGLAFHGAADIRGIPMEKIIDDFVNGLEKSLTVNEVANDLIEYIKQKKSTRSTTFFVIGFNGQQKEMYWFNLQEGEFGESINSRYYTGENDDFAYDILEEEYKTNRTYVEALDFLKETFEKKIQNDSTVGGNVDIILITKDKGIQWISRKR